MNLLQRRLYRPPPTEERLSAAVKLYESWNQGTDNIKVPTSFTEYAREGLGVGTVASLIAVRIFALSEVEFYWRDLTTGERVRVPRGDGELEILRHPWPNGTLGDLVARMEMDDSLAGNAFILRAGNELQRLRPDWVQVVHDGKRPYAYLYGPPHTSDRTILPLRDVAHWSGLIPDPMSPFMLGRSWISSVLYDINADIAATKFQHSFFRNSATPNLLIKVLKTLSEEQRDVLRREVTYQHEGVENAWKTLILEGGADAQVVGKDLQEIEYSATRAAGESRIASAAGVPPIVVGFREGMQASTYSNYSQAVRRFGDGTLRPLWRSMAGALETILIPPRTNVGLWYDASQVAMLRQDAKDEATILQMKAATMETLIRSGYDQASVAKAVDTGNLGDLRHTGLVSVQLQEPGALDNKEEPEPSLNGKVPAALLGANNDD